MVINFEYSSTLFRIQIARLSSTLNLSLLAKSALINASTAPYAGAYCSLNGEKKLIIWSAQLIEDDENYIAVPGQVIKIGDTWVDVACGEGKLRVKQVSVDKEKKQFLLFFINKGFCSRKALLKESMKHVFNDDLSKAVLQSLVNYCLVKLESLQLVKLNSCLLTRLSFRLFQHKFTGLVIIYIFE